MQRLRTWSLVLAVNLGAAVAAALSFGAWKRAQESTTPYSGNGLFEVAEDVGFIPRANPATLARIDAGRGDVVNVVYTTGPDRFRVVPASVGNPDACVLVFGDSFSFGTGVAGDETFSAQIENKSRHRIAVHNFAMGGWDRISF